MTEQPARGKDVHLSGLSLYKVSVFGESAAHMKTPQDFLVRMIAHAARERDVQQSLAELGSVRRCVDLLDFSM